MVGVVDLGILASRRPGAGGCARRADRGNFLSVSASLLLCVGAVGEVIAGDRPNILWITTEDISPSLGCYGDGYAITPNLDAMAAAGLRYTRAFATAPACSPSRSCLITGVYATTLATPHLRSGLPIPAEMRGFPAYLREAGYYCSNNAKTDYNTSCEKEIIAASWDQCNGKAHWRGREPGQPFFAVFNYVGTHQAPTTIEAEEKASKRLAGLPEAMRHDPAKARVPPYYPDTQEVRRMLARYADNISMMDHEHAGRLLRELEEDGLAGDTIVFFYGDHGAGMPRHKRLALDTGLRVPLLVKIPDKFKAMAPAPAGSTVDRFVSFVDFAPTVLALAGLPAPEYMQGEPFLGEAVAEGPGYLVGARDRVDEAIDTVRCVRDGRFLYARNFYPHFSHAAPEGFSDQSPMRQELIRLEKEGKLGPGPRVYTAPTRAVEELYDVGADPFLIKNLAGEPGRAPVLEAMRARLQSWVGETRDLGFVPESELWSRIEGTTPYELAAAGKVPVARIFAAADLVGREGVGEKQLALLGDDDAAVRYWAVVGLRAGGEKSEGIGKALEKALADSSVAVRIEAAGALIERGAGERAFAVLEAALCGDQGDASVHAARTLQLLGAKSRPALATMKRVLAAASAKGGVRPRGNAMYLRFALDPVVKTLEAGPPIP